MTRKHRIQGGSDWVPLKSIGPYVFGEHVAIGGLSLIEIRESCADDSWRQISNGDPTYIYEDEVGRRVAVVDGKVVEVKECDSLVYKNMELVGIPLSVVTQALAAEPTMSGPYDGRVEDM